MQKKAIIISVKKQQIIVQPVTKTDCKYCTLECSKKKQTISVSNPKKLKIEPGNLVYIEFSKTRLAIEGAFSLFFPFICAIGGYFVSDIIFPVADNLKDQFKALSVLIFLILSSVIVLLVTRITKYSGKCEIIELIDENKS